jgi:hypothetical protein
MTTIRIKLPTIEQVEFTLEAEQDDMPVRGMAMASGDDAVDKKVEDEIIDRLDGGDVWAWASVSMTARWKGMEGVNYLGCCSYADEEDFKKDGYYKDMKAEAFADLLNNINALKA